MPAVSRWTSERRPGRGQTLDWLPRHAAREAGWLLAVVAAAIAVVAVLAVPLAVGTHTGQTQAADRAVYYVVANRACSKDTAVIVFGGDSVSRAVRVAHRRTDGVWLLDPGILAVPHDENIVEVRLGRVGRSRPASLPTPQPTLPPRCPLGPGAGP